MRRMVLLAALVTAIIASVTTAGAIADTNTIQVTDADITSGSNVVWTANNEYVLNGFVYVDSLATLTIEPGTVVRAKPGSGADASALVVARGGQLFACGTADEPIIFTSESDDLTDPFDLPLSTNGLWGGVIILGRATTNNATHESVEGLPVGDTRNLYGGEDDDDNSGVISYVSIRYAGTNLGSEPGNEINGLSLGGVGRGTEIHHVEVFGNYDDGVEFWGGTVNTHHMVMAFNGDEAYDYDEGFRGKGQFWFCIMAADKGGRFGEHDGGTAIEDAEPYAKPVIYNVTYIGSGASSTNSANDHAFYFRDNGAGYYYNSIITDYWGDGIKVEDLASGEDSRARLECGDLELRNNFWWGFGVTNAADSVFKQAFVRTALLGWDNQITDPQLRGISRTDDKGLDPRPAAGSPVRNATLHPYTDSWFAEVDYAGAFGDVNWAAGWTFLSEVQVLTSSGAGKDTAQPGTITAISDDSRPTALSLSQNAPNPFNPTTTIDFALPTSGMVKLSIFNLAGQRVATLAEGYRTAGVHSVSWNAEGFASGVYVYMLQTPSGNIVRRMTLVR